MNDFLHNGFCEDELNHGDCMFDGLDCCGYDHLNDGDYNDYYDIAPGDTSLCMECLCKGTGCKRQIRKTFEFKIWKESMLVL